MSTALIAFQASPITDSDSDGPLLVGYRLTCIRTGGQVTHSDTSPALARRLAQYMADRHHLDSAGLLTGKLCFPVQQ